jgi:NADP-dependent 3-hydroxy acid dehydrogenase YdfG
MPFAYKKVLIIGATSGIGEALAAKLVENETQVIISGRRKDNLDAFVQRHGSDKVKSKVFDIMKLDQVSCPFFGLK